MVKLSVKKVAEFCSAQTKLAGEISRISTDSRDIDENTLFVALVGERFDAHDFVDDVLKKGAKAVVCSKYVGDDERIIYVEDTGKALLDIAHGYRKMFNMCCWIWLFRWKLYTVCSWILFTIRKYICL